jgi:hypothetical protein
LVTLLHKTDPEGYDTFLLQLILDPEAVNNYGAPQQVYIKYRFDNKDTKFEIEVYWYGKTATRYEREISKQHSNSKKQCWVLFLSKMFEWID